MMSSKMFLLLMQLASQSLTRLGVLYEFLLKFIIAFNIGKAFSRFRNRPINVSSKTCFCFENFLRSSVLEKNTKVSLKVSQWLPIKWSQGLRESLLLCFACSSDYFWWSASDFGAARLSGFGLLGAKTYAFSFISSFIIRFMALTKIWIMTSYRP